MLEDLRQLLEQTEMGLSVQSNRVVVDRPHRDADAVRHDPGQLHETGAQLAQEYASIGEACRHARTRSDAVTDALNTIEHRLGRLVALLDLTHRTDEKLASPGPRANAVEAGADEVDVHSIDPGVGGASSMAEWLRVFDARVATIGGPGQLLAQATDTVEHLERRAADVHVHLAAMTTATRALAHELVHLQQHVPRLTKSARHDGDLSVNGPQPSAIPRSRPVSSAPPMSEANEVITSSRFVEHPAHWAAGVGALALLALLGTMAASSRYQPHAIVAIAQDLRESIFPRSASALPGRTFGFATSVLPIGSPAVRQAIGPSSYDAAGMGPVKFPILDPAVVREPASRSDVAKSPTVLVAAAQPKAASAPLRHLLDHQ